MKLKLDDAGHVVVQDGKPVYAADDGKEVAFDAPGTVATITRLNGEAKGHRERAEAAEGRLKGFEGISDPVAAIKALDTVKNLDAGKLQNAEDVARRVAEAVKAVEERFAPVVQENEGLKGTLNKELIGGAFSRSKFATDKLAIPPDFVQARFGDRFKLEDGKVVGYDQSGNKLYSKARPGELADFDEALELLVDAYPQKDHILKGSGNKGDGARNSNGQGGNGAKSLSRDAFNALDPATRSARMKEGYTLVE